MAKHRKTHPQPARAPTKRQAPARFGAIAARLAAAVPPLLIIFAGALLYANSFSVPFLFDDQDTIVREPRIRQIWPLSGYLIGHRSFSHLTFAINYRWGELDPWGYHLGNLLVHVANALLLYGLVLSTVRLPCFEGRYSRHARLLASLVALLFVSHPLQTCAITYVTQRMEALAATWYLLALLLLVRGFAAGRVWIRLIAYGAIAPAGYLAMLSKEMAVSLPAAFLLFDLCFLADWHPLRIGKRWLVHALLIVAVILPAYRNLYLLLPGVPVPAAAAAQTQSGSDGAASARPAAPDGRRSLQRAPAQIAPGGAEAQKPPRPRFLIPSAGLGLEKFGPWQYFMTEVGVIAWYLRLFLLPTRLTFDYGWPIADRFWRSGVILPLLLLLGMAAAGVLSARRYRLATFSIGWFFLVLAPSSSFVPLLDPAFEYRMYLPVAALAWLSVVGGYDGLRWIAERLGWSVRKSWQSGLAGAVIWTAVLAIATVQRNEVYQDPLRLKADSAAKAPHHWRARYDYALELSQHQRLDEAIAEYEAAIRNDPTVGSARINLSQLLHHKGRIRDAEEQLRIATQNEELSIVAVANWQLGRLYMNQRRWPEALAALQESARIRPAWPPPRQDLARLRRLIGE